MNDSVTSTSIENMQGWISRFQKFIHGDGKEYDGDIGNLKAILLYIGFLDVLKNGFQPVMAVESIAAANGAMAAVLKVSIETRGL